jgi:hypothetical protein
VHFFQGRFGWLLRPLINDDALVYSDCTASELRTRVHEEHGIWLTGIIVE